MVHGRLHGIARYALELARRLPALAPQWRFSALVPQGGLPPELGALAPRIPLHRSRAPFLGLLEQPLLLAELTRLAPDLFHATSFSLPLLWPGRLVATLHDANHLALPQLYGPGRRAYYRLVVGPRARRAAALLTVSDFSREELARHLDLSPYRLQVIAPGVDASFTPPTAAQAQAFRQRRGLPARYLAVVGNPKPHKNLALLAGLAASLPLPLALLAGAGTREALGFPSSTYELADLPEEEMPLFYGAAAALLMPSRYEGFGLPALEALACGCPVVAARASAIPEVTGEAALLVPPDDAAGWRDAILRLLRDEPLRQALVARGFERAARYSWDDCARRTLAAYGRALEAGAGASRA
ncbi:MAG TPA: glycosyltransferase family 1 protein [Aggregicoccus sp.]|nr:glycosyltransferase family 1 protein [Aggregicoccus sp.]